MNTLIAFLRGVMPSGKNAVKMAELREVLSQGGFMDVRSWIQSGNIALKTELTARETAARIHSLIQSELGADLPAIVKTQAQLQDILAGNPFADAAYDPERVFFTLSNDAPKRQQAEKLMAQDFGAEKLYITPYACYLYIPGSAARSRLGNNFLEKQLGLVMTTRNRNTLSKMAAWP